ncbi:MAG TPA: hypothetical protein DCR93_07615 [Cytophagales bacterium]|nr:hypothetical protein [Cytophagales bacterium]
MAARISNIPWLGLLTLGATLLFLAHQLWEPYWSHWWMDGYLDDHLFLPVVLGWGGWAWQKLTRQARRVPTLFWLSGAVYLVLLVEVAFPRWNPAFTYDPLDFVAYAVGGGFYGIGYWLSKE